VQSKNNVFKVTNTFLSPHELFLMIELIIQFILFGLIVAAGLAVTCYLMLRRRHAVEGWRLAAPCSDYLTRKDQTIRQDIEALSDPAQRFQKLFDYFLAGILECQTPDKARIHYPGWKGMRGHAIEGLEGFARTMPLVAAWLASGHQDHVSDPRNEEATVFLHPLIEAGLLNGTDPAHPAFWGRIGDMDQRAVEAADIALIVWLTRQRLWQNWTESQRQQVAAWLKTIAFKKVSDNNWLLFKVTILQTLQALGVALTDDEKQDGMAAYIRFKTHYRDAGWFFDPPMGVDFYNCWAISYSLHWIDRINPQLDHDWISDVLARSAHLTLHLVSPDGLPIMGRSVCYRMAVPAPVVIGWDRRVPDLTAGQAVRALDSVWQHFVSHDALVQGTVTQGYYEADKRLLDRYSGTGSCQWSLRALIVAFSLPPQDPFWTVRPEPLPIETHDYALHYPQLGWHIRGDHQRGEITIRIEKNTQQANRMEPHSLWRQGVEWLFHKPHQPHNYAVKYGQPVYTNLRPLGHRAEKWTPVFSKNDAKTKN
jgi:hypothetical protein